MHRDIKTLNIVLKGGVAKLCDLGVSRLRSQETVVMDTCSPLALAPAPTPTLTPTLTLTLPR